MEIKHKKKHYKQIAFLLSLCAILVWTLLGTGASLAWFADTSEEVKNIVHFADFELTVSYRKTDGTWESIEGKTEIFDKNALYEPGYVQVVYLEVKNEGAVPFDFKTAVSVTDFTVATNTFGQQFHLQDYLKFGIAIADTEETMDYAVATREQARAIAQTKLSNYTTDVAELGVGQTAYIALVVSMPEAVDNVANYRGQTVPRVELGIIVEATQQKN